MAVEVSTLIALGGLLVTWGAAWGGAKTALNGTRQRVEEIRDGLTEHVDDDARVQREILDRLTRIETRLDQ